jgi:hypothetical protein
MVKKFFCASQNEMDPTVNAKTNGLPVLLLLAQVPRFTVHILSESMSHSLCSVEVHIPAASSSPRNNLGEMDAREKQGGEASTPQGVRIKVLPGY